ncbi:MAG: hypothetical protein ACX932_05365 [Gammaproteobacteria bacterium]
MASFILSPTTIAQWHDLVSEASQTLGTPLDETLESYLVFLLMRYMSAHQLADSILGFDYLQCHEKSQRHLLVERLREVGDKCLLFAGLFPRRAAHRRVPVGYFVDLGRLSYSELAKLRGQHDNELYEHLSAHFVVLMDVLLSMRLCDSTMAPLLSPLEAYDLWREKGSCSAWRMLQIYLGKNSTFAN